LFANPLSAELLFVVLLHFVLLHSVLLHSVPLLDEPLLAGPLLAEPLFNILLLGLFCIEELLLSRRIYHNHFIITPIAENVFRLYGM